jgi:hypothetical protein
MKNTVAILINDDGETWSGVDGASICLISDKQHQELIEGTISTGDLKPIFELGLRDYTEGTMR